VVGVEANLLDGEARHAASEQRGPERAEVNERVGVSAQMSYSSAGERIRRRRAWRMWTAGGSGRPTASA
jgi:hypothetical protein